MSQHDMVVVANRLPVDRFIDSNGDESWRRSPGGLVAALEPVMQEDGGAWIGWAGIADDHITPFTVDGIECIPVSLSEDEVADYYEGMSNDTFWPLYHDVIAPPRYRRIWWDAYIRVNRRFAEAAVAAVAEGGTVWVHDYQLQLVPEMVRALRPDVRIGYFHHIPFPAYGLYSQLPWRKQVLEGLLGADVIGFQRAQDARNFHASVKRVLGYTTRSSRVVLPGGREVLSQAFPISIDVASYRELAQDPEVRARAEEIRASLGNPKYVLLGVDRLDYTKGIRHRLKAFGELLAEGRLSVEDSTLVTVASPSRERVDAYAQLRDEIELAVGHINGQFDTLGHTAIRYLHHSYPKREMVALYLAADVLLVTPLRDGMNLVAKEYVATRGDERGVLVLSEFAGAYDELSAAVPMNPHDIDGTKDAIMQAIEMPPAEQARRMRSMRRKVTTNDVVAWSGAFLGALRAVHRRGDAR